MSPIAREFPELKYTDVSFGGDGKTLYLEVDTNQLFAVDPVHGGALKPVWSSRTDTIPQISDRAAGELWALVSSYEGNLFLVDGTFR